MRKRHNGNEEEKERVDNGWLHDFVCYYQINYVESGRAR